MDKKYCKVCQRSDRKIVKGLCSRHLLQQEEYGYFIDDNSRDEYDVNEIIEHEDYAEIILYDNFFNELEDRVLIDIEDVPIVKGIIWKKHGKSIIGTANQYNYDLTSLILDTDETIEYLDGDFYNNRKSNLCVVKTKKYKHHFANNKKYKNKIMITSLGGSTTDVTGSCFAVEYTLDNGNRDLIILECGSIQTNRVQEDYIENKKMIERIPFNLASAIFLCHAHQDHVGGVAAGITRGFNGKVVTTRENSEIIKPMLIDSAFIHNKNVMSLNNRGKKYELLYDEGDVYSTLSKVKVSEKDKICQLNSNVSYRFTNNNHCVGATQLELFIKKPSGRIVKIYYSSDLGSKHNQKYRPYSEERVNVAKANVCLFESTYGESDRSFNKKEADEEAKKLIDKILEVTGRGNRILLPTFSFDRAQSIMTFLYDELKDNEQFNNVKVIIDSRLMNEINNVYKNVLTGDKLDRWNEVLEWKNFMYVTEFKKTEILAKEKDNPCVYVSSSGMMSAGHVLTYAKSILPRSKDCLCFIGYSSPNTTAGKIQNGAKSITIDNTNVPIRCEINTFKTFTGHAQVDEIITYMKSINCNSIYLHHGSEQAKENIKFKAEEEFLFSDISKKVHILNKNNNQIII